MKNLFPKAALFLTVLSISLSGCQKFDFDRHHQEETWQTTTVETAVASGQTLTYVLPATMTKETPVISSQATNSSLSELVKDANTGQWTYQYKAKEGFVGTDKVVIDSEDEAAEQHGKKGSGHCGNHQENDDYRLALNINTQATVAEQIKGK